MNELRTNPEFEGERAKVLTSVCYAKCNGTPLNYKRYYKEAGMGTMSRCGFRAAITGFTVLFSSAMAQNIYPPSNVMQVGSNVTLELRQVWTSSVQGKDDEGDWTGRARGRDGTQGTMYGFAGREGSFLFQVIYGNNTSEYCVLEDRSSASGNRNTAVYEGFRGYQANRDAQITDDQADCRVTVTNGSSAAIQPAQQPPTQPGGPPALPGASSPTNPPLTWPIKLEVSQKWEWRLGDRAVVYRSTFSGVDTNGVFNGTLLTDGAADPVRSRSLQVFYAGAQDTLAAYATDPEGGVTVCSFTGAKSLQNNVLVGETYFRRPGSSTFDVVANTPCRANLAGASASAATPAPIVTQPSLSFPPQVSVGQTWTVSIPPKGTWNVSVNSRDPKDGSMDGTANGSSGNGVAVYLSEGGDALFLIVYKSGGRDAAVACLLDPNAVRGSTIEGDSAELDTQTGDAVELGTRCSVTLNGGANTTAPSATLTAAFPPKVGQTWRVEALGFEPWELNLTTLDDGAPSGTVKQGSATGEALTGTTNSSIIFYMLTDRGAHACAFQSNSQSRGATFNGGNLYQISVVNNQLKFDDLKVKCSATLIGATGMLLQQPMTTDSNSALQTLARVLERQVF
jgi:hypothetical protein